MFWNQMWMIIGQCLVNQKFLTNEYTVDTQYYPETSITKRAWYFIQHSLKIVTDHKLNRKLLIEVKSESRFQTDRAPVYPVHWSLSSLPRHHHTVTCITELLYWTIINMMNTDTIVLSSIQLWRSWYNTPGYKNEAGHDWLKHLKYSGARNVM